MTLRRRGYLEEMREPTYVRTKAGAQAQIDALHPKARALVMASASGKSLASGSEGSLLLVSDEKLAGGAKTAMVLKKAGWLRSSKVLSLFYWYLTDKAEKVLRKAGVKINTGVKR